MSKIQYVEKRTGAVVPFNQERITNAIYRAAVAVGGRDRDIAENLSQQVVDILEVNIPEDHLPTVEDIQDVVEKVLIENGHAKVAKAYILYREERASRRQERAAQAFSPSPNIPWPKLWQVLDWSVAHGVNTVAGYNQRVHEGQIDQIIAEAEEAYNIDVENAVETLLQCCDRLKIVIITGPSSSGKTTTTIKISQRLQHAGLKLVTLNVDNYFYDLEMHPKDEFGDYDFETPQALDIALINEHLERLARGEEVKIPFYDFKTGKRINDQTPLEIKPDEIILIDSLHGLYEDMTSSVPDEHKFKVYLEPLLQMKSSQGRYVRWTDIRLLRRMLRDAAYRAYDPTKTLLHWHYVRSSEMRHIIPNINQANYIINSGMPYELSIYKPKLFDNFKTWTKEYENDPLRMDAFTRAERVYQVLDEIVSLEDDSIVPPDSVIREFIGGSSYEY
jgi:uridine kinase